ncbi:MAG: 3-methyl-2-oxobutanoate dehydrogenase subunit VorB [Candidatus Omnitrophota bacterium]
MANKKVLMSGNEAIGEGAVQAGCALYAGYPITPQNELIAYMAKRMAEEHRVFIQSESELAAISMVLGASAVGERTMTSSSSPGISLKQEGISYLAGCQLPAVIVNIMRGGPGLGNIGPSQSDYFQATKGGGHGDYHAIVLAPFTVQEAFDLTVLSFELADKYRTPVYVLADGILGQMMEPVQFSVVGSQLSEKKLKTKNRKLTTKPWALTGCKGRKPNFIKSLHLKEGGLEEHNRCLQKKYKEIKAKYQRWEDLNINDAEIILVAYGTMARISRSIVKQLREKGKKIGLIRPISLWPFPEKAFRHISSKKTRYLVIEMSHGQMLEDVLLALSGRARVDFFGRAGGEMPPEEEIIKKINKLK